MGLFVCEVVAVVVIVDLLVLGLGKDLLAQGGHKVVRHFVQLGGVLALAGDDEGGTGFVDEDGVHLVHDGKGMAPLDKLLLVDGHIVTKVVESQLVVGAVGDVCGIGLPALSRLHTRDHKTYGKAHITVDLAHPLGVTLGKVVVDGDHMDTAAGKGVKVAGQNGHQGLTFTGFHFGDAALVQNDAADELHRVGAHAQHTAGSLPDGGKGLRQQLVQSFTLGKALLEKGGLSLQFFLRQSFIFFFQSKDLVHHGLNFLQLTLRPGPENLCKQSH